MVCGPECCEQSDRPARLFLLFHRLAEAKAFTIHLNDFTVVRQAVQQGRCHVFALEDQSPSLVDAVPGSMCQFQRQSPDRRFRILTMEHVAGSPLRTAEFDHRSTANGLILTGMRGVRPARTISGC